MADLSKHSDGLKPREAKSLPFVKLPKDETIVALHQMSKEIYPKWQFWRPRVNYLYAATSHAIYEVDVSTVTLTQRWKNKVKVKHFTLRNHQGVTDLQPSDSDTNSEDAKAQ